ncbi:acetate--CoA ligase family protein [Saccharopolyspora sp. WRP15-2]|uniref:Acetate--CoA ligase family protein n=1 Tax=Saccharopolyspora oryzae TaxID=2997343 RepID=A0ABT4UWT3_9PSEU|nr:acetate--CoA ligase family protein [Saccharopolyspora oryzae]MDA3626173.1 acetate--CoA ligase family protein [Saccharopolyspora oryzae]
MIENSARLPQQLQTAIAGFVASGARIVPEPEAKEILRSTGIAVPPGSAHSDPALAANGLDGDLVLKAVSPTLVHKSDAGGVRVGVAREDLAAEAAAMTAALAAHGHRVDRFLVEAKTDPGHEVIVGAVRTPGVGWVVMVGLGGIFVELFADVSFGIAPLTASDVTEMLSELKGSALLNGARGGVRADIDALVALVLRLGGEGGLLSALPPEVVEVDLNPVIVDAEQAVAVDARMVLDAGSEAGRGTGRPAADGTFERLFRPSRIAVLGASGSGSNIANRYIAGLRRAGFSGTVIPIHPSAERIEGVPAQRSLREVAEPVDYAYVALPAEAVADALTTDPGKLAFAQIISSGFGEVSGGVELERDLVQRMQVQGTRVIGPNCLGMHSSAARVSFIPDPPLDPGGVAVISQSGGLSVDVLRLGAARGIAFHSVTSIGNSSDVDAAELVEFMLDAPDVGVVGMYLESIAAARSILDLLARRGSDKPVVLLAGGRSAAGSRAATSHTGALAGNHRLWPAVCRQGGIALTDTLDEFLDVLLAFATVQVVGPPPAARDAVLFGNGGGASVLATDALARHGFSVPLLPERVVERIESLGLPPGNGLANPIDTPAGTLAVGGGTIAGDLLSIVLEEAPPAILITHLNVGIIQRNLAERYGDVTGTIIRSIAEAHARTDAATQQYLVLKGDGRPDMDQAVAEYTRQAQKLGLPVFRSVDEAGRVARSLIEFQQRRAALVGTATA